MKLERERQGSSVRVLVARLLRYSLATSGPVGVAGAQFLLSLVLLRFADPATFGSFSFLLTASQFSLGISSALFCAVLPLAIADENRALASCLFAANLVAACIVFTLALVVAAVCGISLVATCLFAAYAAVALVRWFARAHAYAVDRELRTTASDATYTVVVLGGSAVALAHREVGLELVYATLLGGAVVGLLPFGRRYLGRQFLDVSVRDLPAYAQIWKCHTRWALLGVATTEATANSHVYIVTLMFGPAGFAPVAATGLIVRPIGVAINALGDYERACMRRQIADRQIDRVNESRRFLRLVLVAAWLATAFGVASLLSFARSAVFPLHYSLSVLVVGIALWLAVAAVRGLRTPEGTLLQAAGAFRALAFASVVSSGISIAAVVILVVLAGPLWSIVGILFGELVMASWIWRLARRWSRAPPVAAAERIGSAATIIGPSAGLHGAAR